MFQELSPDPAILIEGLRDTGYNFNTAVADIVDNSVDADATVIDIQFMQKINKELVLFIADDGCGMNREALLNGMKYGSNRDNKDAKRLGKFGLGLKTASTAFCKRLSVLSKEKADDMLIMATWDLDEVARKNKWELLITEEKDIPNVLINKFNTTAKNGHGTLVCWEKIDRLESKSSKNLDSYLKTKGTTLGLSDYLSMIFNRFLNVNYSNAKNIKIRVNGSELDYWDPFCTNEKETNLYAERTKNATVIRETGKGEEVPFNLKAYVLPLKEDFSSEEAAKKARIKNVNMGFYVYRENRMICDGDWLGLRQKEPHESLCRIDFSFDHRLDAAFKIDVKKSQIFLNPELANWLSEWSVPVTKFARDRYDRKENDEAKDISINAHAKSDKGISLQEDKIISSSIKPVTDINLETREQTVEIENKNTNDKPLPVTIIIPEDETQGITIFPESGNFKGDVLWEPTWKNGHHATRINVSHPFYKKVYVPNHKNNIVMNGLDSIFWALSEVENSIKYNKESSRIFSDIKVEVSRHLRDLVEDLPDPNEIKVI